MARQVSMRKPRTSSYRHKRRSGVKSEKCLRWLRVGAFTAGLGAAMTVGHGVAAASTGDGSASAGATAHSSSHSSKATRSASPKPKSPPSSTLSAANVKPADSTKISSTPASKRRLAVQSTETFAHAATTTADPAGGFLDDIVHQFFNTSPTLTPAQKSNSLDGGVTGTLGAADADGDPLVYTVTELPAHGEVTIHADGSYDYTPSALGDSAQTDSFVVTVTEANADTHVHGPLGLLTGLLNALTFGAFQLNDGRSASTTVPVTVLPAGTIGQVQGIPNSPTVLGTTGIGYQPVIGGVFGLPTGPTRVLVIGPDGSAIATGDIPGITTSQQMLQAPNGGAFLLTYNVLNNQSTLSYISTAGQVTSSTSGDEVIGSVFVDPDGTAYMTTGTISLLGAGQITVTAVNADGTVATRSFAGLTDQGVQVGTDGTAYQGYQDADGVKVFIWKSDGSTSTTAPVSGELVGVSTGPGGVNYLTIDTTDDTGESTKIYNVTSAGLGAQRVLPGAPSGVVAFGADGSAYQVTSNGNVFDFDRSVRISVITPAGVIIGAPTGGEFFALSNVQVASDGTAYFPIGFDSPHNLGSRIVIVKPDGSIKVVPVDSLYAAFDVVIGPDDKLYIRDSAGTVVAPNGTKTGTHLILDLVFGSDGTPYERIFVDGGSGVTNLKTGVTSAALPGGGNGGSLTVGTNGVAYVTSNTGPEGVSPDTVNILAVNPDGSTLATLTQSGITVDVGINETTHTAYVTILDVDENQVPSITVWSIASNATVTKLATYANQASSGPVTVAPSGAVYLTTFTVNESLQAITNVQVVVAPA